MLEKTKVLGKLHSVHGTSPVYLQRAAVVAVLSFVFFLLMLLAFSFRQNLGYFLLATAFLFVQLFTLFGWITQRKNELKIYENGFTYRKDTCFWDEIESINLRSESRLYGEDKVNFEVLKTNGKKITLTEAVSQIHDVIDLIDTRIAGGEEISDEETTTANEE